MKSIPIPTPENSARANDPVMRRLVEARASISLLGRELNALRADRDQLLAEYTDARLARPVHLSPAPTAKPGRVRRDRIRISFGDVHGQRMDRGAVRALLADVTVWNPDELVLGGDIVECGGWLARHQPLGFVASCDYSYQEDIAAANWFLDQLQEAAPHAEIHYLEGNHEDRIERWCVDQTMAHKRDADFLRAAFAPSTLLRLAERGITFYNRHAIHCKGAPRGWIKLGKMFFTHSLTYSQNAARDAVKKTAGNVTFFCTHREDTATVVYPGIGMVKAFNPGCLCQMQPIWRHSDPTSWSQGYAVDLISTSGLFQRVHVPIYRGQSLAGSLIRRFHGNGKF